LYQGGSFFALLLQYSLKYLAKIRTVIALGSGMTAHLEGMGTRLVLEIVREKEKPNE
jgi:hypothetical protein